MGIARSTYYDAPAARTDDVELLSAIITICNEFEAYGWLRVQAALRHQGVIANHKRIKRLGCGPDDRFELYPAPPEAEK